MKNTLINKYLKQLEYEKLLLIPLLLLSLTTMAACSTTDDTPDTPSGNGNMLVLYFSAEGHTQAIAERIVKLTGADIHRIEAAEPYAANPYDDSDRIQHEAYNDLRPGVANLLDNRHWRNMIQFSSVRLAGGINPQW